MRKLRMVIPKGRIFGRIAELLRESSLGFEIDERRYIPHLGDPEIEGKIMKPQNIGRLIELGAHDVGFTGYDWIVENGSQVEELMDLGFDRVRIVAAVPQETELNSMFQRRFIVASEYENISRNYLAGKGCGYIFIRTNGATEAYPPDDADMIIDNVSTGRTLEEHSLRIVDEIMTSSTRFIANQKSLQEPWKREKIEVLQMLFQSVLNAKSRVMLEMNVGPDRLEEVVKVLPCMRAPTVAQLYLDQGYAVKAAVKREDIAGLIPRLKRLGATDILEYEFQKVVS